MSGVHRTVSDAQAGASTNLLLSGIIGDAAAKIYWIVWCAPDCLVSQKRPRQQLAAKSMRNQRTTRVQRQRSPGRTVLFGVPRGP
jgi:hypothetical protein